MSSDRFWKNGWRNLLYFCSTFKISSLACSFSLERKKTNALFKIFPPRTHLRLDNKIQPHLSISFCTSSMCSIASCCSFSEKETHLGFQNEGTCNKTYDFCWDEVLRLPVNVDRDDGNFDLAHYVPSQNLDWQINNHYPSMDFTQCSAHADNTFLFFSQLKRFVLNW